MKDFLPYFAGYIDGDGHFRFRKYIQDGYECFHCKIMITSTCEEPLKFFKENIGGSYYAKFKAKDRWKQEFIYTLHISSEKFDLIKGLGKFLIEKKPQFDLVKPFLNGSKQERLAIINLAKELRDSFTCNVDNFSHLKDLTKDIKPTRKDFLYLAGFIDSECCLTVTKKTLKPSGSLSFSCHLRCASTKFPCIEFLIRRFGGCIYFKSSNIEKWSASIQWQLTDKSLEGILTNFMPFLINKKEQASQIKIMRETFASRIFPRDTNFLSYYSHFTPIRESIYSKVKSLNKRGI